MEEEEQDDNEEVENEVEAENDDENDDFFLVNEENQETNFVQPKESKKRRDNIVYNSKVYKVNSNKKGTHITFDDDE